ncbi:hypothetical protein H0H93_015786 [Arthromyces matolae]|nr:hypothetical protein H0H93_015786 [Arthromyces matolae]
MGICKLWSMLEPAAQVASLKSLSVNKGFVENAGGVRAFRVGIDASAWLYQARYRRGHTKNPELVTLLSRCVNLLSMPLVPLFVFDGDFRPKIKRKKRVVTNPRWLELEFQELLECFGFHWIKAPGEAEAELAWMSRANILDVVLTQDSDTWVFGAKAILRTIKNDGGLGNMYYEADDIASHPNIGLRRGDFIAIAILAGGDYSAGIAGCGVEIAARLARSGLGTMLFNAAQQESPALLLQWRQCVIEELRNNKSGLLKCKYPAVAAAIPQEFPDQSILNLYMHPKTSEKNDPTTRPVLVPGIHVNLSRLANFSSTRFAWGTSSVAIYEHFSTTVLPCLAVQQLVVAAYASELGLPHVQHLAQLELGGIIALRRALQSSSGSDVAEFRIKFHVTPYILKELDVGSNVNADLRAWVPVAVMDHVHPHLCKQYSNSSGGSSSSHVSANSSQGSKSSSLEGPVDGTLHSPLASTTGPEIIDLTMSPPPQGTRLRIITHYLEDGGEIMELTDLESIDADFEPDSDIEEISGSAAAAKYPGLSQALVSGNEWSAEIDDDIEGEQETLFAFEQKDTMNTQTIISQPENEDDINKDTDANGSQVNESIKPQLFLKTIAEASKGVTDGTHNEYKGCDEMNLDGSTKPKEVIRQTYSHAQKMRAAATYGFGRLHGLGSLPWHESEISGKKIGNPSVSNEVSSYMVSLRRRKVHGGEASTSARAITPDILKKLFKFNHEDGRDIIKQFEGPIPRGSKDLHSWGGARTRRLLQAVYTLAFVCLLRFDEVLKIEMKHLNVDTEKNMVTLMLPFRKTHQYGGIHQAILSSSATIQ